MWERLPACQFRRFLAKCQHFLLDLDAQDEQAAAQFRTRFVVGPVGLGLGHHQASMAAWFVDVDAAQRRVIRDLAVEIQEFSNPLP